ncbi:MAG: DUF2807 domain-containing protein [Bacteroidales bacterium]|nr:DUF2807 domain-containing protein [Bacteroidales bacterium]
MQRFITLSILALSLAYASADELVRYQMDVNDFTELRVTNGLNVDYKYVPDSVGKAVFTTTPELASVIMLNANKEKLELQIATEGTDFRDLPTITVYSSFLTRVVNSGDSLVRVVSVSPCPKFEAKVIGNGRIVARDLRSNKVEAKLETGNGQLVLYGKAQEASYSLTGSGSIQADELKAINVKCRNNGTGTIGCAVDGGTLSVSGMGSGKIYYTGTPDKISKGVMLGIKLISLDDSTSTDATAAE